ncbi:MAG: hypothetical protein U5R49_26315 [Deltaproteobacteria bacterium]|nr:hypothetical protein [Deltaproteobacteria bacterium]
MFSIQTTHISLRLGIARVSDLKHHEAIIPRKADHLVFHLRNWVRLQNPVIVDENLTVIDGHHRAHVLEKLSFQYIPICQIDYFNPAVQLRYWFRRIRNIVHADMLKRVIRDLDATLQPVADRRELEKSLCKNRLHLGVEHKGGYYCISFPEQVVQDAVSAYCVTERIQSRLLQKGEEPEYIPCQSVLSGACACRLAEDDLILWTPRISKEMVVDAVARQQCFSPKATRHLIPARPLNVNIPLHWLKGDIPLSTINSKFLAFLSGKGLKRFPPGQIIDGRYYQEELFVFVNKTG